MCGAHCAFLARLSLKVLLTEPLLAKFILAGPFVLELLLSVCFIALNVLYGEPSLTQSELEGLPPETNEKPTTLPLSS